MDRLAQLVPSRLTALTGGDGRPWARLGLAATPLMLLVLFVFAAAVIPSGRPTPADVVASSPEAEVVKMCGAASGAVSPAQLIKETGNGDGQYAVAYTDTSGTTWAAYIIESSNHRSYGLGNCHEVGPIYPAR